MAATFPTHDSPVLRQEAFRLAQATAGKLRLAPCRGWRTVAGGNFQDATGGDSLEFHEHREYLPGDDPRHLDWQAYARTDRLILKVYRTEASPLIDLVIDGSASMTAFADKSRLVLATLYTLLLLAGESGRGLRIGCWGHRDPSANGSLQPLSSASILNFSAPAFVARGRPAPDFSNWPFRRRSLRIFLTDGLYPGDPLSWLGPLGNGGAAAFVLLLHASAELQPSWRGVVHFREVEHAQEITQAVDQTFLEEYQHSWQRHFSLWRQQARRSGVQLLFLAGGLPFWQTLATVGRQSGLLTDRAGR